MFQPAVPFSGYAGWRFLQSTFDRQLEGFANSPQIRNDQDYLTSRLSEPVALDEFLNDRRLLRISLTAFGLEGEEWKRGFIEKALTESAKPDSTFLARLNNPQYTRFAEAISPRDGKIVLTRQTVAEISDQYTRASFAVAIGESDASMRLALNFQSEIGSLVGNGSNEEAILFRLLGDVPARTVLEGALGLPTDIRQLPVERQAEALKEGFADRFGVRDLARLKDPEVVERIVQRFHVLSSAAQGPNETTPGAVALTLLSGSSGVGPGASRNLFLSFAV